MYIFSIMPLSLQVSTTYYNIWNISSYVYVMYTYIQVYGGTRHCCVHKYKQHILAEQSAEAEGVCAASSPPSEYLHCLQQSSTEYIKFKKMTMSGKVVKTEIESGKSTMNNFLLCITIKCIYVPCVERKDTKERCLSHIFYYFYFQDIERT